MSRILFNSDRNKCDNKILESMLKEYVKSKIALKAEYAKYFDNMIFEPFTFGNKDYKYIPYKATIPLEDNVYFIIDVCSELEKENINYSCKVYDSITLAVSYKDINKVKNIIKTSKKIMPVFITLEEHTFVYIFKSREYIKFVENHYVESREYIDFVDKHYVPYNPFDPSYWHDDDTEEEDLPF